MDAHLLYAIIAIVVISVVVVPILCVIVCFFGFYMFVASARKQIRKKIRKRRAQRRKARRKRIMKPKRVKPDAVIVLGGKKDEEIKKRLSRKALEKVVKKSSKPSKELSRRISKERSKSAPVNTAEATPKVSSQDASKETLSNPPGAPYHKTSKERQEVEDMSPGTHARKTLSGSSEVPLSDQSLEVVHSSTSLYSAANGDRKTSITGEMHSTYESSSSTTDSQHSVAKRPNKNANVVQYRVQSLNRNNRIDM